ncbi:dihydrofolate reductase [Candidatus Parcubacteria bacterium]|nr:MAG: dihydrofolate reductase [Candidatus Parcubacteria bacterium]
MKLILMMAQTVDGIIAKDSQHNANWTTKADKKSFLEETKKHGVIIMGSATYLAIGKALPGRLNFILSSAPKKFKGEEKPGELEFVNGQPNEILQMLEKRGFQSAVLAGGARTNAAFLKKNLVDEILITIEPKIFGTGLNFTEGQDLDLNLALIESRNLGDNTVQLRYKVIK